MATIKKIEPGLYEVWVNGKSIGHLYRVYHKASGWTCPCGYAWTWDVAESCKLVRWGAYDFDKLSDAKKQIPMMIASGDY